MSSRLPASAGIAIGPILFILAMLALLGVVMASGNGDFQTAGGADRITADIVTQANLIRSTISQCNLQYVINVSTATSGGSYAPVSDPYPLSALPGGTLVSALLCDPMGGSPAPSLWNNATSAILLPQPTKGFNPWMYIDDSVAGGGRCIWALPSSGGALGNSQITSGLSRAASKFNSAATNLGTNEVIYDPASTSQKFVVWITPPSGTPNSNCLP